MLHWHDGLFSRAHLDGAVEPGRGAAGVHYRSLWARFWVIVYGIELWQLLFFEELVVRLNLTLIQCACKLTSNTVELRVTTVVRGVSLDMGHVEATQAILAILAQSQYQRMRVAVHNTRTKLARAVPSDRAVLNTGSLSIDVPCFAGSNIF